MATRRTNFIDMELEWLEAKAQEIKEYCDAVPIKDITDRQVRGGKVTATKEQQITSIRASLQDYIKIIEAIDKLREKEQAKKVATRGDQDLSPLEAGEI